MAQKTNLERAADPSSIPHGAYDNSSLNRLWRIGLESFEKLIEPHCHMTAELVSGQSRVLSVGDTTYLDYGSILEKREGYGPQGNGGNGLLLHSALAIEPEQDQSLAMHL